MAIELGSVWCDTAGQRVVVTQASEAQVEFHCEGGGWTGILPLVQWQQLFSRALPLEALPWRASTVELENNESYPCWLRGEKWNGWECPRFERETVDRLLRDCGHPSRWEGDSVIVPYDGEDAVYLRETISPGSHQIDVWAIGAGCWTWSEEERRDSEDLGPGSSNIPVLETCLEGDYAMGERIGESTTKRREMGGKKQYGAVIRNADGSSASETEFSDWFTDDDAARVGFVGILREQGYEVASVEIGFPCVVTLK